MRRFLDGNRLALLCSGREFFPALVASIEAATRDIWLESYLFADDAVGHSVAAALIRARQRGVEVSVLVDGFGARRFPETFGAALSQADVRWRLFRPEVGGFSLRKKRLRRMHRKLAVIDARIAFVGGINIIDDDNGPPGLGPRFDFAVKVEGRLVQVIREAMLRQWELVLWATHKRRPKPVPGVAFETVGHQKAQFLTRDNLLHRNDIADAYLSMIRHAKQEVRIACAYFLPGWRFRHALSEAARRGVDVRILLQGKTDHPLVHYATQALYGGLLRTGVRIFEYEAGFLHAKVGVIDRRWSTVGSSNMDPFSLFLAREANLFVVDDDFSRQLDTRLLAAMKDGATEIRLSGLQRLSWFSRLLRWLSYGLMRYLAGLIGAPEARYPKA
ncbi:MAG: cardiolipin synthase ClsB [Zoogloeaceae bacterium]|jgi:cardiolipin synthase|nr:cardiolipin synthase ClsB [Zoogloeaceae bacterium]